MQLLRIWRIMGALLTADTKSLHGCDTKQKGASFSSFHGARASERTAILLPSSSVPLSSAMAFSAPAASEKVTTPQPSAWALLVSYRTLAASGQTAIAQLA